MKLWIDVNDLFVYARHHVRPSGIQRLSGELYSALVAVAPSRIGFVVHGHDVGTFEVVQWPDVERVYAQLTSGDISRLVDYASSRPSVRPSRIQKIRNAVSRLAQIARRAKPKHVSVRRDTKMVPLPGNDLRNYAGSDDFLCSLGAPWWHAPAYAEYFQELKRTKGMRLAVLVYDLIPVLCPEFYDVSRAPGFAKVMRETLPLAEVLLTISHYTSADVLRWATAEGIRLMTEPLPIPIGSGFASPPNSTLPPGLKAGGFVLLVATIEVRKNHFQAFRVWQRMLQEMPRENVPILVFVGTVGWMVGDLLHAIDNTNRLDGKIMLLHDVDDGTLSALYRACRFTIFPSYYEGWGLPVSDSLAFGKLCIASNRTSIPEAGGSLCLYIDPDNATGAYEVVRKVIEDPRLLLDCEERIRTQFQPVQWTDTARAVLGAIDGGWHTQSK